MNQPPNTAFKVIKPLYVIPDRGLHWYSTYLDNHVEKLCMTRATLDPCVLMKHDDDGDLTGMVILQLDDSFEFWTDEFLKQEVESAKAFRGKPRNFLT